MSHVLPMVLDEKSARIVIVDDEWANLALIGQALRSAGYRHVVLVQDPREVVEVCAAQRPDLILLDLAMPVLDGYAVMASLRELAWSLPPPIVVLTSHAGEGFLSDTPGSGANDYLQKPVRVNELLIRVRTTLWAHLGYRLLHDQSAVLESMVRERTSELAQSSLDLVRRLGRAAEYRDGETGQHVLRMSHASALLARRAGWDDHRCDLLLNASPMHDVGKIGIPDDILRKAGPLTPDERRLMHTHTTIGADILDGPGELLEMARAIALHHHEKWDGSGYPQQLAGTAIPEAARIVAIADVFDALTSERSYKPRWSTDEALDHMRALSGTHFDPRLLELFFEVIAEAISLRDRVTQASPFDDMPRR